MKVFNIDNNIFKRETKEEERVHEIGRLKVNNGFCEDPLGYTSLHGDW